MRSYKGRAAETKGLRELGESDGKMTSVDVVSGIFPRRRTTSVIIFMVACAAPLLYCMYIKWSSLSLREPGLKRIYTAHENDRYKEKNAIH